MSFVVWRLGTGRSLFHKRHVRNPVSRPAARHAAGALHKDQITVIPLALENEFLANFPAYATQLSVVVRKDDSTDKCHIQTIHKFYLILSF